MKRTGQDLEGVLGVVEAAEAAQAARHHKAQRQRKVRQRLVTGVTSLDAPLQAVHRRLVCTLRRSSLTATIKKMPGLFNLMARKEMGLVKVHSIVIYSFQRGPPQSDG